MNYLIGPFYAGPFWRSFLVAGEIKADVRGLHLIRAGLKRTEIELWGNKSQRKWGRRKKDR